MSMYTDVAGQEKGNKERCECNSQTVAHYGLSWGLEEKWYGTYTDKPDGSQNQSAENMMANFSGSGLPIFRYSSAFERGELRSKGGGKKSLHFYGTIRDKEQTSWSSWYSTSSDKWW